MKKKIYEDYKKNGFVIVDNYLPVDVANKLESVYSEDNNEWELFNQYRDQAYGSGKYGKHKIESPYFPGEDEVFTSKFWRSNKLELETENKFDKYFLPNLKLLSGLELTEYNLFCFKLDEGCHYRTHIDDWVGSIGCNYYINKKWIWDWGGIFHLDTASLKIDDSDSVVPIFPKFNRAVFVDHTRFRFPHFISHVSDYAKEVRYSLVSFGK